MKGKFLANLVLLVVLNLLIKPFYILGIDASIQNTVGAEEYGNYFALLNFSFLFNILLDFGITTYNNRAVSRNSENLVVEMPFILGTKMLLLFLYFAVSLILGISLQFSQAQWTLLWILLFNQFLVSLILYVRSNLGALQLFKRDGIISVTDRVLLIFICGTLLWTGLVKGEFQIEWFAYAQTIAYALTLVMAFAFLPKEYSALKIKFDRVKTKTILKRSWPFALLIMLMMLYNRIDSVMLERMLPDGKEQSGFYAQGYRLLDASHMFIMLFGTLLLPLFSRMIKNNESVITLVETSAKTMAAVVIPLIVLCYFFPEHILELLYSDLTAATIDGFRYLMLGLFGISMTYIYGALLTAKGEMYWLNIMAGIGIAVNLTLNVVLIPRYQVEGAALATFITQTLTGLLQFFFAQYFFKFQVLKSLIPILLYTLGVVGLTMLYDIYFEWSVLLIVLLGLMMLILAWVMGMLQLKPIVSHLKSKK